MRWDTEESSHGRLAHQDLSRAARGNCAHAPPVSPSERKVLLDAEPGSFETVRQLLGQKNIKTTTNFYAGIDSRRAGRHQQRLIERTLEAPKPTIRRKKRGGV